MFGGGARTLGLLYAAPGAGALLGAVTTGWVRRIRRQGRTVIVAVIVWGAAITGFGLVHWLPAALALLAVAGLADVISAVFRNTIIQLSVPDALRGRLMGVQMAVVTGGPRIGDAESGAVAAALRHHRVGGLRRPRLHSGRPDPGPPAPGVHPPEDTRCCPARSRACSGRRCRLLSRDRPGATYGKLAVRRHSLPRRLSLAGRRGTPG